MSYKKKYKSMFGAKGLITAPNYLAEKIVKKRADKKGLRLPNRIWDRKYSRDLQYKYWHGAYFGEYKKACDVLSRHDEGCVIKAIDSYECEKILSLYNQTFERVISEFEKIKEVKEQNREKIEQLASYKSEVAPKPKGNKSKIGKLR